MSKVFFSTSIKGGVGKTVLAALVADAIHLYAPTDPLRCFSSRADELYEYVDEGIRVEGVQLDTAAAIGEAVESVGEDDWAVFDFVPGPNRRVLQLAPDLVAVYPQIHILYNVGNENLVSHETFTMLQTMEDRVTVCYVQPETSDMTLHQMVPSLAAWQGDTLEIPRLSRSAGHVGLMNKRSIPQVQRLLIQTWKHRAINAIRDHFDLERMLGED
jgi:hypothetical protein